MLKEEKLENEHVFQVTGLGELKNGYTLTGRKLFVPIRKSS